MDVSKLKKNAIGKRARRVAVTMPLIAAVVGLSACSPGGETSQDSSAGANNSAGGTHIVVIGGASDDAFFSSVKRGVDDAAKTVEAGGGKVTYLALQNYSNIGPDAAQLAKNALGMKPSAIAIPDWVPAAEDPAIREIVAAGIPVVVYNAGNWDKAEKLGALSYIGTDEYLAGVAAGEALAKGGAKKALCVNTVPGAENLEDRCRGANDGMAKSGGSATQLALPASSFGNQTAVTQAIKAGLQQDTSVDGLTTVGSADAEAAAEALRQADAVDRVKYVSFNLTTPVLERVKAGTQLGAVDQQPYPQGYYTVSSLFQYVAYGVELPTKPILTGPLVVDKDNVEKAISGAAAGVR